jgi:flagellar operon protein
MSVADIYRALGPIAPLSTEKPVISKPGQSGNELKGSGPSEFQKLLEQKTEAKSPALNLSQHAETRIRSRAIAWNPEIERRVISGIDAAQAKGSRETLILADDIAVIANVKSRTVITAMDRTQMKEKIFTNIDSAVLV